MTTMQRFDYTMSFLLPQLLLRGDMAEFGCSPSEGDIVVLMSAPSSEWCISIFVNQVQNGEYLLESLRTGRKASWSNVGLLVIKRSWADDFCRFKWTDEMFAFEAKLSKAGRKLALYMERPYIDAFVDDSVRIVLRTRHEINKHRTSFDVQNWRRATIKALSETLAENVDRYKRECAEKRSSD